MDRLARQKINKEALASNDALDQMDLIDRSRTSIEKQQNIHILFKYTWNILQDRSHARSQNKSQ